MESSGNRYILMHWCTLVHLGLVNLSYCSMYSVSKIWFLCFHEHVQVRGELLSSWFRFVIRLIIIVEAYSLFFLYFIKMFVAHNLRLLAFLIRFAWWSFSLPTDMKLYIITVRNTSFLFGTRICCFEYTMHSLKNNKQVPIKVATHDVLWLQDCGRKQFGDWILRLRRCNCLNLLLGASSPEKQVAAGRDCALAVRKYKLPCLWLRSSLTAWWSF
jgi:hypothetical protein